MLVTINYSSGRSQAQFKIRPPAKNGEVIFEDMLTGNFYIRNAGELAQKGLYVDLEPWHAHIFKCVVS